MKKKNADESAARDIARLSRYVDCSFAMLSPSVLMVMPDVNMDDTGLIESLVAEEIGRVTAHTHEFSTVANKENKTLLMMGAKTLGVGRTPADDKEAMKIQLDVLSKIRAACAKGTIEALYDSNRKAYRVVSHTRATAWIPVRSAGAPEKKAPGRNVMAEKSPKADAVIFYLTRDGSDVSPTDRGNFVRQVGAEGLVSIIFGKQLNDPAKLMENFAEEEKETTHRYFAVADGDRFYSFPLEKEPIEAIRQIVMADQKRDAWESMIEYIHDLQQKNDRAGKN